MEALGDACLGGQTVQDLPFSEVQEQDVYPHLIPPCMVVGSFPSIEVKDLFRRNRPHHKQRRGINWPPQESSSIA